MREVIVRVTCDYCGEVQEDQDVEKVTLTVGSKNYEVDPCPSCLAELVSVMRPVKKEGEFACEKCGKTYAREKSRDKHQEGCTA